MLSIRRASKTVLVIAALAGFVCSGCRAQAVLLLEEPYGFFGTVIPTGHSAIYLKRICAETPVKLRRCGPDELGSVISRYQGIANYDWVAIPLVPYLYSVENATDVSANATREQVKFMRDRYHETRLQSLGDNVPRGSLTHGGWTELLGTAYERRIYAFRLETTAEQDDALIARLNARANRSRFNLFYNNCADFGREILNFYLPGTFKRRFFPDAVCTQAPRDASDRV